MGQEIITADGEVIETMHGQPLALGLARAEIDQQIATAHQYPRSMSRATKNILSLATLTEESAAACIYALPRGGKPISGPSVRLAEIVAQCWGNNRIGTRIVNVDRKEGYIEAEGVYHDLESNSATVARVRRRITDRKGQVFNDDMIIVTGNAASSIARRNAIFAGVPRAVWGQAEEQARKVIAGDVTTLTVRRDEAIKAFAHFGVKPEQVLEQLGLNGLDEITLEHIVTLRGMFTAIKNGEATVEDMFAPKTAANAQVANAQSQQGLKSRMDALATKDTPASTVQSAPDPSSQAGEAVETAAQGDPNPAKSGDQPGSAEEQQKGAEGKPSPSPSAPASISAEDARRAGAEAAKAGKRRTPPPQYRDDEALFEAWLKGFDVGE